MIDLSFNSLDFTGLLVGFRRSRKMSQLDLALTAEISARHLGFLETGRASPSSKMVMRLAKALALEPQQEDALLLAAGFAPRTYLRQDFLDRLIGRDAGVLACASEAALAVADARTEPELLQRVWPALGLLEISHFFVSVLRPNSVGGYDVDVLSTDGFPVHWLDRYRDMKYAAVDPFLHALKLRDTGFFWEDVIQGQPDHRVRRFLDDSRQLGLSSGYVQPLRRRDGTIQGVSMMGERVAFHDPKSRLALQTISLAIAQHWPALEPSNRIARPINPMRARGSA
jgi:transcriptional regulator with XRE-family HTH domain